MNLDHKVYLVGGYVRDFLLGIESSDKDYVVVGSSVGEMLSMGMQYVGNDFPVFINPDDGDHYALARRESRTGYKHTDFSVECEGVTLEEDLKRRDLTINSMAMNKNGEIIDPFGGYSDLSQRILRHTSPAFQEDALRVLRVARFQAKLPAFNIAPETMEYMEGMVEQGLLHKLTPERVWVELEKALLCERPRYFFEVLKECGALRIVFPELFQLIGVPQPEEHHGEVDCFDHSMNVLDEVCKVSQNKIVRLAAVLHDIGKGQTPADILPHHYNHDKVGSVMIEEMGKRLRIPYKYSHFASLCARNHMKFHLVFDMTDKKLLKLCEELDVLHTMDKLNNFITVCVCDIKENDTRDKKDERYAKGKFLRKIAYRLKKLDIVDAIRKAKLKEVRSTGRESLEFITNDINLSPNDICNCGEYRKYKDCCGKPDDYYQKKEEKAMLKEHRKAKRAEKQRMWKINKALVEKNNKKKDNNIYI